MYEIIDWMKQITLRVIAFFWELTVVGFLAAYYIAESIALTFTPSFMRTEKTLRNKVIVITGGAGGVGQELAVRLARNRAKVVIWDINEKGKSPSFHKTKLHPFTLCTYMYSFLSFFFSKQTRTHQVGQRMVNNNYLLLLLLQSLSICGIYFQMSFTMLYVCLSFVIMVMMSQEVFFGEVVTK